MEKLINLLSRIRLRYRRSSNLLKCVLLVMILLSSVTLVAIGAGIHEQNREREEQRRQAAALEQENQQLEENSSQLGTVDSAEQIANEELGLVDKDTVIFDIEQTGNP